MEAEKLTRRRKSFRKEDPGQRCPVRVQQKGRPNSNLRTRLPQPKKRKKTNFEQRRIDQSGRNQDQANDSGRVGAGARVTLPRVQKEHPQIGEHVESANRAAQNVQF